MRSVLSMSFALALSACAVGPMPPPPPPDELPPRSSPDADECGATALQGLVGQDRARAPSSRPGRPVRVFARGDAVTMDFNPYRLNVEHQPGGGRILRVYCG